MATSYTSLLGLALPVTGELSGTWGDTVNTAITALLDTAIAGTTTLSTDADVTLTTTTGAANQARQFIINCTGARTVLRTITAPAQSKAYVVINATSGGFGVKLVGVGPTTGVTIDNGSRALVVWNGSDFIAVSTAQAYPGAGIAVSTGSAWTTSLTAPSGTVVGTTDTQTLTRKTLTTPMETITISATAATGTINFNALTQGVLYYTTNAAANWTLNVRGDGSTTLDSIMSVGQVLTVVFMPTQGSTAYYQSAFTIDGSSVTPKWLDDTAPSAGTASSINVYTMTIIKTGSGTFTVLGSVSAFG